MAESDLCRPTGTSRFRRARRLAAVVVPSLLVLWFAVPLPRLMSVPAILVPLSEQIVYVPFDGILDAVSVRRGDIVRRGQELFRLASPRLDAELAYWSREEQSLQIRLQGVILPRADASQVNELRESLERTRVEIHRLAEIRYQMTVRSALEGVVLEWDDSRKPGQAAGRDTVMGRIGDPSLHRAVGYVLESDRAALWPGQRTSFYSSTGAKMIDATIASIHAVPTPEIAVHALTSIEGGPIPVRVSPQGECIPVETCYEMEVTLEDRATGAGSGSIGRLRIMTKPRSRLVDLLKYLRTVLAREVGI